MTMDDAGDMFIADTFNNSIRKVTATNGVVSANSIITTVAGARAAGYSGASGPASTSELADPLSIAVDRLNNIYVADSSNNAIRKINGQSGQITTLAGNNPLSSPVAVAIASTGMLSGDEFIADTYDNEIDEIDTTGKETVVAGNGTAGDTAVGGGIAISAELDLPEGIAVDGHGNLFIADTGNNLIREVNLSSGLITTIAGNGTTGYTEISGAPPTADELNHPTGVALDDLGNLFIADTGNNVIRKIAPAPGGFASGGTMTTFAGDYNNGIGGYSGEGGLATKAKLNGPQGIAIDSDGNVFIADSDNNRIREVVALAGTPTAPGAAAGRIVTVAGGGSPAGGIGNRQAATDASLSGPTGVALDGERRPLDRRHRK